MSVDSVTMEMEAGPTSVQITPRHAVTLAEQIRYLLDRGIYVLQC
jgi:hypothetical protein